MKTNEEENGTKGQEVKWSKKRNEMKEKQEENGRRNQEEKQEAREINRTEHK